MKKLTFNPWRHFLLALALPAVAICAGLQSCSEDDGPGLPADKETDSAQSRRNPLMRSPEEAIDIAQRAWEDFYGDGEAPASRSSRGVIDYGRPVEVVRGAGSRGGSSDTLLYVVNFADDGGFAVIAAPRGADELLAVTSQGHYYPESQPDQEKVPGFELWMENAREYAATGLYPVDTTNNNIIPIMPPIDVIDTLGPGGKPVLPPTIIPPVTRDTTGTLDPDNPNPGRIQQKEWEDTIQNYISGPYLNVVWGQGNGNPQEIDMYNFPEGAYFENGWAGCSTAAIAMICAHYESPSQIRRSSLPNAALFTLDWSKMKKHKNVSNAMSWVCGDDISTHYLIADFYKIIATWTDAKPHGASGTNTNTSNVLPVLREFLPHKTFEGWSDFKFTIGPSPNELFIMRGRNGDIGHMWLADGFRSLIVVHYYATRPNSNCEWQIQSQQRMERLFVHHNWGWDGLYNGWYNNAANIVVYRTDGMKNYKELKYSKVS